MKKIIAFLLFVIVFFVTKEIVFVYIENFNTDITITFFGEKDILKFELIITIFSLLVSFTFLVFYYYYKINIVIKVINHFISLLLCLKFISFIYSNFLTSKILVNEIFLYFLLLLISFIIINVFIYKLTYTIMNYKFRSSN